MHVVTCAAHASQTLFANQLLQSAAVCTTKPEDSNRTTSSSNSAGLMSLDRAAESSRDAFETLVRVSKLRTGPARWSKVGRRTRELRARLA